MIIDCADADVLAAAMSVGSLDEPDGATLQGHLFGCEACRRTSAEYMAAAARLPLVLQPRQPSPELRSRLMRAVYAEAAQRESAPKVSVWQRFWASIPTGRGFTVAGAAAAIAVIALTVRPGGTPGTTAQPSVAMTLTGEQGAPTAHGQVIYSRDSHVALVSVTGLPGPALSGRVGSVYEVWLIPAKGNPVGAAYLTQSPSGTWTAAVQADLSKYSMVAATEEPSGGSQAPTGAPVVQGSIVGA